MKPQTIRHHIYTLLIGLLAITSELTHAQDNGILYVNITPPTQTTGGTDATTVGYSGAYLIIKNTTTGETRSAYLNGPSLNAYTFKDLALGEYQFQSQAYDAIGCAGKVSDITTHQVYAPREPLDTIVANVTSAVQPEDPAGDCDADGNCDLVNP